MRLQVGAGAADDLSATGVHSYTQVLTQNARITRIYAYITTAVVSSGAVVVTFRRRPVYGASTNQSTLGTLSIPAAQAKDGMVYKDITPVNCNIGDEIAFEVTTAAAGGGAAGGAIYDFEADMDPETAANQSKLVASA